MELKVQCSKWRESLSLYVWLCLTEFKLKPTVIHFYHKMMGWMGGWSQMRFGREVSWGMAEVRSSE